MNANASAYLFVILGVVIAEMGGIGLIIWNHKFPNPQLARKYGVIFCILGIIGFLWGVVGVVALH
jgi:hypothetical protein